MECAARELSSDKYEKMYAKHRVLNPQFGKDFWCQSGENGARHCGDAFPVRWADYATDVARQAEAFLLAHHDPLVKEAVKTLTAYQYYLYQMPLLMAQMTGHFYSEGVTVYGYSPSLYISEQKDRTYVALYFKYILGADRLCRKTYQIPQFQGDDPHITLFNESGDGIHWPSLRTLQTRLEDKNRSDAWLPIAPWQKPSPVDSEYLPMTQFYFMGSELINNLSRYASMDKTELRKVLDGHKVYHVSL